MEIVIFMTAPHPSLISKANMPNMQKGQKFQKSSSTLPYLVEKFKCIVHKALYQNYEIYYIFYLSKCFQKLYFD